MSHFPINSIHITIHLVLFLYFTSYLPINKHGSLEYFQMSFNVYRSLTA